MPTEASSSGMEPILKSLVSLIAVVGGCVAAYKAIFEMRSANKQRALELRWKKAQAARDLIKEIHSEPLAMDAIKMLNYTSQERPYAFERDTFVISGSKAIQSLSIASHEVSSASDIYVRDCFDWLYYYMGRLEHFINTGYIDFIDVESVFRIYAGAIVKEWDCHRPLIMERQYSDTLNFLRRFYNEFNYK